ncbi:MAG: NAD(P)H-dependent oxidoreductase [Saprospiraceae bacterium]|nr:NAD(P)H-dependent oxidoreductase [Saprospiraceae bacterium]
MKNILLVFAHPEPKSMNGLLKSRAMEVLTQMGYQVKVRDLYALDFPIGGKADFPFYKSDFFDLQLAQAEAERSNRQPAFIKQEQEALEWADAIVFQFPLWWYSVPAILKSYFDHVFSVGFAYAGRFALEGKKYMLSFTTGAPEMAWTTERKGSMDQVLFHLDVGVFQMLRVVKLPPFVGYGSKRLSHPEREALIDSFGRHIIESFS